jgi:hypothetical protein
MDYIILIIFSVLVLSLGIIIFLYILVKFETENKVELYFLFIISGEMIILILAFLLGVANLLLKNI